MYIFIYMCVCVCVYIYIYIYICIYMCVYIYMYMYTRVHPGASFPRKTLPNLRQIASYPSRCDLSVRFNGEIMSMSCVVLSVRTQTY